MTDPAVPPTDPAVPPTDPAVPPADPAVPPADPAVPPADPAVPPADPAVPPRNGNPVPGNLDLGDVDLSTPEEKKYDSNKEVDMARKYIAYWLLGLLSFLVTVSFVSIWFLKDAPTFTDIKALVELLLGPIIALVSAATGFYFGATRGGTSPKG